MIFLDSAIISVYKKDKLDLLLEGLTGINPNINIVSSGGTARKIKELGYNVVEVSDYTGFPESPGGLVKTLHPKVHGGILLDKNSPEEYRYLMSQKINSFDIVVCNLYPFKETVERGAGIAETVEMIDIGGPTLIRSAAKGCLRKGSPITVVDPEDYGFILEQISERGSFSYSDSLRLAKKAFRHTRDYDTEISKWLGELDE